MRKQVFSGDYVCPVCEDEFELERASGDELLCPSCDEELEPVIEEPDGDGRNDDEDDEEEAKDDSLEEAA